MGKSRRKTPITGNTTAASDKPSKVRGHRQARAAVRVAIAAEADIPHPKAFGDPWNGEKDGKHWHGNRHPDLLRK
ncbi:hypothetical protein [Methylobacterium mesophilicum]